MQKNRKKGIFSNVGYYAVLLGVLWAGNGMADVKVVDANTDQQCLYGIQCKFTSTICPAGYAAISCVGPKNSSHDNDGNYFYFNAYTPPPSPSVNPNYCPQSAHAICAKVCN